MEPGGFIPLMFMNSAIGCGEVWRWSLIRPAVESSWKRPEADDVVSGFFDSIRLS